MTKYTSTSAQLGLRLLVVVALAPVAAVVHAVRSGGRDVRLLAGGSSLAKAEEVSCHRHAGAKSARTSARERASTVRPSPSVTPQEPKRREVRLSPTMI